MRTRTPYTECKLYYDGARLVLAGQYLKTPAGSAYWIQGVRHSKTIPGRVHLKCLRWPVAEIPPEATVHPLHWYARPKRSKQKARA